MRNRIFILVSRLTLALQLWLGSVNAATSLDALL